MTTATGFATKQSSVQGFLGKALRRRLLAVINGPELAWTASDEQGMTGRGAVYQVTAGDPGSQARLRRLRGYFAEAVYRQFSAEWNLPAASALDVQVFPVRMEGGADTRQLPHVDRAGSRTPLLTCVYYAETADTAGGELVLEPEPDGSPGPASTVVRPVEDLLVAIDGRTLHAVSPLRRGRRTSLVCNFYAAE